MAEEVTNAEDASPRRMPGADTLGAWLIGGVIVAALGWWFWQTHRPYDQWPKRAVSVAQLASTGYSVGPGDGPLQVWLETKRHGAQIKFFLAVTAPTRPHGLAAAKVTPVRLWWRVEPPDETDLDLGHEATSASACGELCEVARCDAALRFFDKRGRKIGAAEVVWDLGSPDGELVDGNSVALPAAITHQDKLECGKSRENVGNPA